MIRKEDLYSVVDPQVIAAYEDTVITTIIDEQYAIVQAQLPDYDWEKLTALALAARPAALVKYLKDKILYTLHAHYAEQVSASVQAAYEEAKAFFTAISVGNIKPPWPKKQAGQPWGSHPRYQSDF